MATITLLDDSTRPKAPKLEGAKPHHAEPGKHLKMIHRYHLMQMNGVRRMMEQIDAGGSNLLELGHAVSNLKMHESFRQFGNLCGQECEMLNAHHSIESQMLFPVLHERGNSGIKKLVERLMAEHEIIHHYLQELQFHTLAILQKPSSESYTSLKQTFTTLEKIIHSHFRYEETELAVAIGFYGFEF